MKNLKTFDQFINESKKENPYSIETPDAKEFMMAIDNLPDSIKSVKVETELSMFNPANKTFKPSDKSWKKNVKDIVKKIVRTNKVIKYEIRSYFGDNSKNPSTDPYYITYQKEGSEQFANDMATGKYGPLD
jgi:hypothetical protein